ncbi:MAG: two-component sensor histidine kinase [Rhizobiales bacterium PAR1]|nr:MAG: two-component sensor histidine kinase [Rhizobiales bacterium PAR1]
MSSVEAERPKPEAFLDEARLEARAQSARGKLKIFLGASPGVGKTYSMLEDARMRKRAGIDVVVALIETHGRAETAALLGELESLPRRAVDYRGQTLTELDLDALLARRPRLALIDELAHTNAPGSRHPKRWQDVMEVIDAGIDVTTTLNIQHIESLNDAIARITGVRVQETVPDEALQRADDIELIDLPPEELIKRLNDGKVYVPQQVGRALENFFTKGKLTALRELALRTAASRVDADMLAWMDANAVRGPWPTDERLLVCVNEAPVAKTLVRTGKRMADRARIPWLAVTVVTPRHEALGAEANQMTREALTLAATLGAETATLYAETDVAGELLTYARKNNANRILVGRARSHSSWLQRLSGTFREAVSERLLDQGTDFEITVISPHARLARKMAKKAVASSHCAWRGKSRMMIEAAGSAGLATLIAWPLWPFVPVAAISIPYLVAVLLVSFRQGLGGAILASTLGFLSFNFFFTTPYYSFEVEQHESVVALIVFFISAIFTGTLASRLKAQVESMRAAQRRTETLYDFARKIASVTKTDDVLWAAVSHVARVLDCHSLILMPDARGALQQVQGFPSIDELDARAEGAARWAYEKNEPAGLGTSTLPMSEWLFVPLSTARGAFGVIGVQFRDKARTLDPETSRLLMAVEDQVSVAVERTRLTNELANARVSAESDKLRTALLNSVSHDLRTPLVSVIGAISSLADKTQHLSASDSQELTQTALDEARRLDRYVQNLLDMTRLGHGALKARRAAVDLREIVGRVRTDLERVLGQHTLVVEMPRNLPMVDVDPVLIGQALANVLENAAKYAPAGSSILISAHVKAPWMHLAVSDEGPGIPASEKELVFDAFHRVSRGDGQPAGTGLGLAIVRGLIEAHGGTVKARDGLSGNGTIIELTLPLAQERCTEESEAP